MTAMANLLAAATLLLLFSAPHILAQAVAGWPGFRGTGGNGHATEVTPPLTWNATDGSNILWKTALPKHGMSSPIVAERRLFVTAADDDARQILCYDTDTGKLLWHHDAKSVPELPEVLEETGFAAPTPATDGRHVAAVFATGELVCVNVAGERVWATHLGIPKNHYGHASSLLIHDNLLFVQFDDKAAPRLLAFELLTGKPAWQVKRGAISWTSPILVENKGRMELILTNSKKVDSYDPKTGKHLWEFECLTGEVASSAAYADGIVFVASEGATAAAIDISKHDAEPRILWRWDKSLPDAASLLAAKDLLIIPTAFGVITCLDARTGSVHWEHEFPQGFNSSPILANDRIYIADINGDVQVFKLGRKFEQLGHATLAEATYATPAFVGTRIFIRGITHLFCIADGK